MKKNKILILLSIVVLVFSIFLPLSAFAQQTISISLWPPILEIMIQPGRQATQNYQITNNSDQDLKITPYFIPFKPSSEKGEIKFDQQELQNKNFNPGFFAFESGEQIGQPFWLKIGQTKQLSLKILIPKETPEKDYYYTLLFSATPASSEKQTTSTASTTEIGSNILLTVSQSGTPKLFGNIKSFSCPHIIDSFSPVNLQLIVENYGPTYFKTFGTVSLKGILKQSQEIELLPQNILADSSRKIEIPAFKPKLPLGPFTATANLSLNEEGIYKLSKEISFWYIPYKLLLSLLAMTILFLIFKKFKNQLLKNKQKT